MSMPPDETAPGHPPTESPPAPDPTPRRREAAPVILAAAVASVVIIVMIIAAAPFWAPAVMHALPWGTQAEVAEPVKAPAARPVAAPPPGEAELAALKAQAAQNAAVMQQLSQRVAALEAKPAPAPPDLRPLEQQLGVLDKTTTDLDQRVAALDKAAQQRPAADPKNIALALALLQIREAVETGRPFDAEYQALAALARDNKDITAAAVPLAAPAASGVASRAVLTDRLRQLAPQIAAARPAEESTWTSGIVARLRSLVTIRRIEPGEGQTPAEAAVATAQHDVASSDLAGAVGALDGLAQPNRAVAEPWLKMAKTRLAVETALRQVQAALIGTLGAIPPTGKS